MPSYSFSLGPAPETGLAASQHHFAANLMFDRDFLDAGGPFRWAVEQLGVTGLRYPGGAITEELAVPGSTILPVILSPESPGIDPATGARFVTVGELATFVNTHGFQPVIVLPSIYFRSSVIGPDGFHLIDYAALDDFLEVMRPLLQGDLGVRPHVVEIGNETLYGERMAPVEYGRLVDYVAPRLAAMLNDSHLPMAEQTLITAQVGLPWVALQNAEVLSALGPVARAAIDAVVGHYYISSYANVHHTTDLFDNMLQWDAALGRPLQHFISEWNVRSTTTTDTGLAQASTMLEMMRTMLVNDIEHAAIWGTQMRNLVTRLSGIYPHPSVELPPEDYARWLTAPGEVFRMMSHSLQGLRVLDVDTPLALRNALNLAPDFRPTASHDQAVLHAFGSDDRTVLFLSSRTDRPMAFEIDLSGLVPHYTHIWAQNLTVRDDPATVTVNEGDPLSRYALPFISTLNALDLIQNGRLTVQLEPWAILRVSLTIAAAGVEVFGYDQISDPALNYGDTLLGAALDDTLSGFLGDDLLSGLSGNDQMLGGVGNDTLNGGQGNDTLVGGAGSDVMAGGVGNDVYDVDHLEDVVTENAGEGGADRVVASVSYRLGRGQAVEQLVAAQPSTTGAITLTGNTLAQQITGNAGANVLSDGGGAGADTLTGLAGNDIYVIRNTGTIVIEQSGQGTADRVSADVNFVLAPDDDIELMATTFGAGTTAINLTGNALAQAIIGNAGANVLSDGGGAGVDTLTGHGGNDTYIVRNPGAQIVETEGRGTADRVAAGVSFVLAADDDIEILTTTSVRATTAINLTGNALVQAITGNAGVNVLADGGGAGVDRLAGLAGNDTYIVRNASSMIVEIAGQGTSDHVAAGVSFALAADDDIEILTTTANAGTAAINLTGNTLAQTITGNAGVNVLDGQGGNDTMTGGAGADDFVFSTTLGAGNVDRITDFAVGIDDILLLSSVFGAIGASLSASEFRIGAAVDANDFILYNEATGALTYDSNGNAAGGATQFATLQTGLALTVADFGIM